MAGVVGFARITALARWPSLELLGLQDGQRVVRESERSSDILPLAFALLVHRKVPVGVVREEIGVGREQRREALPAVSFFRHHLMPPPLCEVDDQTRRLDPDTRRLVPRDGLVEERKRGGCRLVREDECMRVLMQQVEGIMYC